MQLKLISAVVFASCVLPWFGTARAEDEPGAESPKDRKAKVQKFEDSLEFKDGKVTIGKDLAVMDVPKEFRFLGPRDARRVLEELWGNPKDTSVLGLLLPSSMKLSQKECWAIVVTYDAEGYVKDDDAASLDYSEMLSSMKEGARRDSVERVKQGYPPVELIGWAAKPHYDAAEKKLYWAKELKFGDSDDHTLNYNIRILGRRGVLVLNAIAEMDQLEEIDQVTPKVLAFVDFKEGNRYRDFDPGMDKVATYGIGALIAGGVAVKVGLFKGLWIAILAAKKFVILGVIAVGALVAKVFRRKKPEGQ